MSKVIVLNTFSEEQTYKLGQTIGKEILNTMLSRNLGLKLGFTGDLGAGKTLMIKGIMSSISKDIEVSSPTYTIINDYELNDLPVSAFRLLHVDLYRIEKEADLDGTGFWEAEKDPRSIMLIEWIDRLDCFMDNEQFDIVSISYGLEKDPSSRLIRIKNRRIFTDG